METPFHALCKSTIVFGIPLEEAALNSDPQGLIPSPLRVCINYIEQNALWTEDLYIASGSWIRINDWKDKFNRGDPIDLRSEIDVDVITGIIKLYIHDLPENILTMKIRDQYLAELKTYTNIISDLRKLLAQLQVPHRASAELLFNHLKRVCDNSNAEILPFHLASCFGGIYITWIPLFLPICPEVFTIEKSS